MTFSMPDSVTVGDLPPGYPAYLGYTDGAVFPATCRALAARFPAAKRVCLTTNGSTADADGVDCERGDLNPVEAAHWTLARLGREPGFRPVVYASVSVMPDVIGQLSARGIARARVRLLSAHYRWAGTEPSIGNYGEHICGPATCAWPGVPPMDGTQWTNAFPGVGGRLVDMSLLVDGFFGESWTETLVQELPVVREGDSGEAVRTVQGLCNARLSYQIRIDGVFGEATKTSVVNVQQMAKIAVDGVVGELTWPVLLGLTP